MISSPPRYATIHRCSRYVSGGSNRLEILDSRESGSDTDAASYRPSCGRIDRVPPEI